MLFFYFIFILFHFSFQFLGGVVGVIENIKRESSVADSMENIVQVMCSFADGFGSLS